MNKITECQMFITRTCNIRCGSCKLAEKQFERELTADEWKSAFTTLENIGIKTVKIMGGEPTTLDTLEEILEYINAKTNIRYALLSNSLFDDKRLDSLVRAGIQGYFASVNVIEDVDVSIAEDLKSSEGFAVLKKLRDRGVKLLGANVVITAKNLHNVPKLVTALSDEGIWINVCPVIHDHTTKSGRDWEYRKVTDKSLLFENSDIPALKKIADKLLELKRNGVRLAVPDSYLLNMPKYGIDCSWQCSHFSQLRIDADGALMLCNDIRGDVSRKYNIKSLTYDSYNDFQSDWIEERKNTNCSGCYWSCFYLAEENMKNCRNEFYYMEG